MFQFPHLPSTRLCVHLGMTRYHPRRVAPFGFPRIIACPQLPEAFRRVATSFFGLRRQGIHRAPFARFYSVVPGHATLVSGHHHGSIPSHRPTVHPDSQSIDQINRDSSPDGSRSLLFSFAHLVRCIAVRPRSLPN